MSQYLASHRALFRPAPALALVGVFAFAAALSAQDGQAQAGTAQDGSATTPPDPVPVTVAGLAWRHLGPANMSGRVTDIEVVHNDDATWYVGTAGGGVWKTRNAGTTWERLFADGNTNSVGDVAVAPSNPDVVWIGSGEENARNSVSWGDGVYKSTDAGKTFQHTGLRETFQIGHIAIHPTNADVVFVAALGQLWGDNPDRGVYRTKDGGETWERVLYLDDKTGCIDVRIDPQQPERVYALMYERKRGLFDDNDPEVRFGEQSGLFVSTDGGDSWSRVTEGLPTVQWGRSGMSIHHQDPNVVYLIIETERSGWATGSERLGEQQASGNAYMGMSGRDAEGGGAEIQRVTPRGPSADAGLEAGDVVTKVGETEIADYKALTDLIGESKGGDEVDLTFKRGDEERTVKLTWGQRGGRGPGGGGAASSDPYMGPHSGRLYGQLANRQDQQGEDGFQTGGVFRSDDRGVTWKRVNSLTDRPFYYSVIQADPSDADSLWSCGTSLFLTRDGGKEFDEVQRNIHVDFHALWVDPKDSDHAVVGCDGGIHETFDGAKTWLQIGNLPVGQPYHVGLDNADPYNVYGGYQDNGTWAGPSRTRWNDGILTEDWVTIMGGDGFRAIVDQTDPSVVFATSQNGGIGRVDMATHRGGRVDKPDGVSYNWDTPFFLSPHNQRIFYFAGTHACRSFDQGRNSQRISERLGLTEKGTASAFAESPLRPGLLYVGTDDGALWRTDDGGHEWVQLNDKLIGLAGPRYVSSIEPSRHEADRVYVTFDGHRSNDFASYVLVSQDRGKTWKSLSAGLPDHAPARILREDPRRADLLFVGTEFGAHVSVDRGAHWHELGAGLPTVAVHDLAIHDRDQDLVAATHGTAFWVLDIAPLRELGTENFGAEGAHLFRPERATLWNMRSRDLQGHRDWAAPNPAYGATIQLWLAEAPKGRTQVTVHDVSGAEVASLPVASKAGFQVLNWDCRVGAGRRRSRAPAGSYSVRYQHGEKTLIQPLRVRPDPGTDGSHALSPAPYAGSFPATFPEPAAAADGDQDSDRNPN